MPFSIDNLVYYTILFPFRSTRFPSTSLTLASSYNCLYFVEINVTLRKKLLIHRYKYWNTIAVTPYIESYQTVDILIFHLLPNNQA